MRNFGTSAEAWEACVAVVQSKLLKDGLGFRDFGAHLLARGVEPGFCLVLAHASPWLLRSALWSAEFKSRGWACKVWKLCLHACRREDRCQLSF